MALELTHLAPQPEPEVEGLRRYPKPGSSQWLERYRKTLADFKDLATTCPSMDPDVKLALAQLAFAMEKDVKRHG